MPAVKNAPNRPPENLLLLCACLALYNVAMRRPSSSSSSFNVRNRFLCGVCAAESESPIRYGASVVVANAIRSFNF